MSVLLASVFALGLAVPVLDVPSGQPVELFDVLIDEVNAETWLRFRFLAPEIARDTGSISFVQAEPDLEYLCAKVALPYMMEFDLAPEIVAVMILDQPMGFGVSDPDVTQFVDLFRVSSGACVWEGL
ncbi:hypothetical protein ROLI_029100 [Roseobacter fucihabitans]|uniref:Acetolactate synthase n=1 Tax=Roseobacter fucihabitans TaxID=1537242 RepID=A0ABZ2BWJ3_9RHOB|nr:hypothetical protein [Roseobacter litoralis]